MITAIYVFLPPRTPLYASLRGRHIENIEKLCAQLCETLCNKKKKDHKVTRRITQSSTKKTLRNIICSDFHSKEITF